MLGAQQALLPARTSRGRSPPPSPSTNPRSAATSTQNTSEPGVSALAHSSRISAATSAAARARAFRDSVNPHPVPCLSAAKQAGSHAQPNEVRKLLAGMHWHSSDLCVSRHRPERVHASCWDGAITSCRYVRHAQRRHVGQRAARLGLRTDGGRREDLAHMRQGLLKVLLLHGTQACETVNTSV